MKYLSPLLCAFLFSLSLSASNTFILYDVQADNVIESTGSTTDQTSPCSTFKVPLALMGFDSGHLKSVDEPEIKFKPEYKTWFGLFIEAWKNPQTPQSWLKYSCIWYSMKITKHIGLDTFNAYVQKLNYGNKDITGDEGKNNGLTHCWLSSSLKISPDEQLEFIKGLLKDSLPFSKKAHKLTRDSMPKFDLDGGWTAYGKTGSGYHKDADPSGLKPGNLGWFIGWIEKDEKKYIFVSRLKDIEESKGHGGRRCREWAKTKLNKIVMGL